MKESISYTYLLNIIIIFIVVAFMVIMGTLSYTKAYRVNSKIADAIEKCEGYNSCSIEEIGRVINNYGYQRMISSCDKKEGKSANEDAKKSYGICLYVFEGDGDSKHYSYGITTFMYLDIPVISQFLSIPVYAKTDRIYNFQS